MYSSSSSSSQQQSSSSNPNPNPNLIRYDSAPSSLLSSMVDSVIGDMSYNQNQNHHHQQQQHQFFSPNTSSGGDSSRTTHNTLPLLQQGPYGNFTKSSSSPNNDGNANHHHHHHHGIDSTTSKTTSSSPHLIRQSSSPAGLLAHLASDIGYSGSKGFDVNYNPQGSSGVGHEHMLSRLGSQMSFTRKDHHSLSQISEVNEAMLESMNTHDNNERKRSVASQSRPSSTGFSLSAWDDNNDNNFIISTSSSKRGKAVCDDYLNGLSAIDSQQAMALEMATMERLMHVPHDSVPCKIRAKRGFATHPRSIAERERRTRISGKLKKLQELVPNMDKQTSYSDMLDLAVQHIKGLQGHIEKLNHELDNCTCGCKPENKQP